MALEEIRKTEQLMFDTYRKLVELRKSHEGEVVRNYEFSTSFGKTTLLDLFGNKETLFVIHNMGETCSFCTLWADGLNGFLPHLEEKYAVAFASKDSPDQQRRMANDRGWRFQMVSHDGGSYIQEQSVAEKDNPAAGNYPGIVCYQRSGDTIRKKNFTPFGPGDEFCSIWNILSLAGIGEEEWNPEYRYWKEPQTR